MKLKATHNNLIIEPIKEPENHGAILIANLNDDKPSKGKVISSGPGYYSISGWVTNSIHEGDIVYFPKFSGVRLEYDDIEYVVCKDTDIVAIEVI